MKMNGSRILIESLKKESTDTVFCYVGGAVIPIFDAFYQFGKGIKLIMPRHEQGGAHAADGYARSTGKTGVVIVTSGPGATNTVTGIATAFMDSVPMVIITGQVSSNTIGTDAFQESDITGITAPITKANFLINSVEDIAPTVKKAFRIANTGRKGPVLIDIPVDIQKEECEFVYSDGNEMNYGKEERIDAKLIYEAINMINRAKRPLIISGGGVISSDSTDELNKFVRKRNIPVVNTLMGYGTDTGKESLNLGGLGMHGTLYGNYAVLNCDLLIALGTRFSDRILGDAEKFAPKAKIIHVDIDPAEIGKNKFADLSIVGSLKNVLSEFNKADINGDYSDWIELLEEYKLNNPMRFDFKGKLKPQFIIRELNKIFPKDTIVVTDVGQNQMWVPQFYKFVKPRCHLTSGGLGTMGYALPSAIGAKVGNPSREVLMFAGDGGFQMNIQELITIRKYGLNIKMIILDNAYLGMVRQWQQLICDSRYCMTCLDDNPDFVAVAEAFGIKAKRVETHDEFKNSMVELRESREAMILHTIIEREENVLPMVPAGKPMDEYITEIKTKTV